ncbi:hypothetical protein GGR51DRAFT_116502 [Nemania sp. FL0031]|nr:hypothetical protein GGR51DRAFT_116502 [Nemania sp. FL0031]
MANSSASVGSSIDEDPKIPETEYNKVIDIINNLLREYHANHTTECDEPLLDLAKAVQGLVSEALQKMKKHTSDGTAELELYYRLNEVLLGLEYWNDEIVVEGENALTTIEKDKSGFAVIVKKLRGHFNEMKSILAQLQEQIGKATKAQPQSIDGLDEIYNHLIDFVRPLRTFLERKHNVGRVAVVRRAAPKGLMAKYCLAQWLGTLTQWLRRGMSAKPKIILDQPGKNDVLK